MDAARTTFTTIDDYTSRFPKSVADTLEELRRIIRDAAPGAEEAISYNMPAFRLKGVLVYYAACRDHIGFYPTSSPIQVFKDDLAGYKCSKGAIHFPLGRPIPAGLIRKIVEFRVQECLAKASKKRGSAAGT